jgi:N6-adenosine-specific RNA methylase IME4
MRFIFLWFTNNHMIEAAKLIEHWGFTHKSIITWEKISKNGNTRLGVGHWLRNCTEHCAIATKGKKVKAFSSTSAIARSTPNLIKAERREHSRKPEQFYKLVEDL